MESTTAQRTNGAIFGWIIGDALGTTVEFVNSISARNIIAGHADFAGGSLSNGFLMRLPGLVALHAHKNSRELVQVVLEDMQLTHGHPEAPHIACIYAMMLTKAINGAGATAILDYGRKKAKHGPLFSAIYSALDENRSSFVYDDREYRITDVDKRRTGFAGFAIWMLLLSVSNYSSYRDALLDVAKRGGDTNECIAGAVMGALHPDTIPKSWIASVVNCKSKRHKTYPLPNPDVWMQFLEH